MGYTESASSPADRPAKLSCSMLLIAIQHPVEALHAGIANADASSDNSAGTMVRTLTEQYSSCQTVLLSMLQERRTSGLQLACLNAIMDFTRAGIAFHSNQFNYTTYLLLAWCMVYGAWCMPEFAIYGRVVLGLLQGHLCRL